MYLTGAGRASSGAAGRSSVGREAYKRGCEGLLSAAGVEGVDVCFAGCSGGCDIGATGRGDKGGRWTRD